MTFSEHKTPENAAKFPYWVKLLKQGDTFTGYSSKDAINWRLIGSASISMSSEINVGLCLTSHEKCAMNTAKFDHVIISEKLDTIPNITSIDAMGAASTITIYPNPATNFVTFDLGNSSGNVRTRVQIVDLLGNQVNFSEIAPHIFNANINTSQFAKGIYIVNITKGSEKISKKLVIQ